MQEPQAEIISLGVMGLVMRLDQGGKRPIQEVQGILIGLANNQNSGGEVQREASGDRGSASSQGIEYGHGHGVGLREAVQAMERKE